MERIPKMLDFIEAEIKNAVDKRKQTWKYLDTGKVKLKIQNFIKKQGEEIHGDLFLTYLKSSYILGSHEFKVAIYKNAPFIELYPPYDYINMTPLFVDIKADMDILITKLGLQFIRILPSEIEEIRRYYVEWLYNESSILFKQVFSNLQSDIELPAVFFGAELGEVKLIEEM